MSPEVEHFLIAAGAIAGVVLIAFIIFAILRFNPRLRERVLGKLFPSMRGTFFFGGEKKSKGDSSTLFGTGSFWGSKSRGAMTERTTSVMFPPRAPAALAIDDNATERRYSRQNLVRGDLLRRQMEADSEFSEYETPPPIYSGFQAVADEKAPPVSRAATEVYVADGFRGDTAQAIRDSQTSNSTVPPVVPPTPSTVANRRSLESEAPRFRGVNSWVSNVAHRMEDGKAFAAVLPEGSVVDQPIGGSKNGRFSGAAGRFPRSRDSTSRNSSVPATPVVFRVHPGARLDTGAHHRVMSEDLDRQLS